MAIDPVGGPLMGKCIATMPYRGRWISLASMAAEGHAILERGENRGKVVLTVEE